MNHVTSNISSTIDIGCTVVSSDSLYFVYSLTKKQTPAERATKVVIIPQTRGYSVEVKKQGSILGYFTRKPVQPPELKKAAAASSLPSPSLSSLSMSSASASALSTKRNDPPFRSSIMGRIQRK